MNSFLLDKQFKEKLVEVLLNSTNIKYKTWVYDDPNGINDELDVEYKLIQYRFIFHTTVDYRQVRTFDVRIYDIADGKQISQAFNLDQSNSDAFFAKNTLWKVATRKRSEERKYYLKTLREAEKIEKQETMEKILNIINKAEKNYDNRHKV